MRRFIISATLALCLLAPAEAAPHRLRVHPNPSLTILAMTDGPDGLLWLATSSGLYRFDGFHYHKITDYPFPTARFVAFTRDGSLWAADFAGLTRVLKGRFEIVLTEEVHGLAAYPDQVFVGFGLPGLMRIGLDGSVSHLKTFTRGDLDIDSSGRLWYICSRPPALEPCWLLPN